MIERDLYMNFSLSHSWLKIKSWFTSGDKSVYTAQPKTRYSKKVWICFTLFLIALFGLYVTWMITVPMAKAPDESVRIILSDYVFQNGHLPNAWDKSVRIDIWGFSYALRPMLANILGAFNMWIVSFFTQDPYALFYAARIVSCFFWSSDGVLHVPDMRMAVLETGMGFFMRILLWFNATDLFFIQL